MHEQARGTILVISGPSGVGKDTLIKILISNSDLRKFAAYTTRPKREGEIDGVDYFFLSEEAFLELLRNEEFLDHLVVSGYHYGTPLRDFQNVAASGRQVVLHLAVETALLLKSKVPETKTIFVLPPTRTELVSRLRKRGMSEEDISTRVRDDPTSISAALECDFIIVNHTDEELESARRILKFLETNDTEE